MTKLNFNSFYPCLLPEKQIQDVFKNYISNFNVRGTSTVWDTIMEDPASDSKT